MDRDRAGATGRRPASTRRFDCASAPALRNAEEAEGHRFDFAFIDADKANYAELLRALPQAGAHGRPDRGRQHALVRQVIDRRDQSADTRADPRLQPQTAPRPARRHRAGADRRRPDAGAETLSAACALAALPQAWFQSLPRKSSSRPSAWKNLFGSWNIATDRLPSGPAQASCRLPAGRQTKLPGGDRALAADQGAFEKIGLLDQHVLMVGQPGVGRHLEQHGQQARVPVHQQRLGLDAGIGGLRPGRARRCRRSATPAAAVARAASRSVCVQWSWRAFPVAVPSHASASVSTRRNTRARSRRHSTRAKQGCSARRPGARRGTRACRRPAAVPPVHAALGHHPVHRDVPALRVDGLHLRHLVGHADDRPASWQGKPSVRSKKPPP